MDFVQILHISIKSSYMSYENAYIGYKINYRAQEATLAHSHNDIIPALSFVSPESEVLSFSKICHAKVFLMNMMNMME